MDQITRTAPAARPLSADREEAEFDNAEHERTFRMFVRGIVPFAAHVLLALIILAYDLT